MAPPLISAAMIVKNEARHLPACLECLSRFADEICVTDTGSEDSTADIARQFGCITGHYDWCGDFSAARNAALALCTGEWVFVADADEYIAPEDAPRIRALTAKGPGHWFAFIARNYTNEAHLSDFTPCTPEDVYAHGFAGWYPA